MKTDRIFVAETGISHCGNIDYLKEMIDQAAIAGAHAVKTQYRVHAEQPVPPVGNREVWDNIDKTMLSFEEHLEAREYAKTWGLKYGVTVFCREGLKRAVELKPEYLKVGSGESMHLPFVEEVKSMGYPTVVSTGMCTPEEIDRLKGVYIMGCVSRYPASREANIAAMRRISKYKDWGFSDHSPPGSIEVRKRLDKCWMIERHLIHQASKVDVEAGDDFEGLIKYFAGDTSMRTVFEPTWVADRDYETGEEIKTDEWIRCGYGVRVTQKLGRARVNIRHGTPIVSCMIG